tara:strand:+ start:991 stop:1800 length:810 start_codon:yes stop_codon:yes gene_type:complete
MKILVIGGSGYIGKAIVKELLKENYEITILSRNVKKAENTIQCDLLNKIKLKEVIKNYDLIINLASIIRTLRKSKYKENIQGLKNLIEVMDINNIKKLIYFSTINVHLKNPGKYGNSKIECEKLIKNSNLDYIILRPNYVYGIDKNNDIYKLLKIIKTFKVYPSIGNGEKRFQPINKEDLASITLNLVKNFKKSSLDLSGSELISFNEIVNSTNLKHLKLTAPLKLLKVFKKILPFDVDGFKEDRVGEENKFTLKHNIREDIKEIMKLS